MKSRINWGALWVKQSWFSLGLGEGEPALVKTGEVAGNLRLGTRCRVQEMVENFLAGLANRKDEMKRRCRTVLETKGRRARARFPVANRR